MAQECEIRAIILKNQKTQIAIQPLSGFQYFLRDRAAQKNRNYLKGLRA
jgi:hypothetical protein